MSTFTARYTSQCWMCPERIREGDEAIFIDGEVAHARCPEVIDLTKPRPLCQKCFLEMPILGPCGSCE